MKYLYNNLTVNDSRADEKTLRFLSSQTNTFIKHIRMRYPDEPCTQNILSKFSSVQLLPYKKGNTPSSYISGMYDHSTGILKIAARDGSGNLRSTESLNKSVIHELAHATRNKYLGETSHSNEWKGAWKRFLQIATEELKWDIEAPCSSKRFYGLSEKDCPKCVWPDNECSTVGGQLA